MNNDTNTRGLADFVFLCGIATINVLVCVSQHTIIIIRHQLDLNRRVSATTNSLFKGLPSRLRPFGLQFSIIFAILLLFILVTCRKGRGKAVPLQACSGPEGSTKIMFPDFMITAQDDGKVVSLTHRLPLPPGNTPGTHFC